MRTYRPWARVTGSLLVWVIGATLLLPVRTARVGVAPAMFVVTRTAVVPCGRR